MIGWKVTWQQAARTLKRETYTLFVAYSDQRTPWYAKAFAVLVVAYAFSPLDLIPDPIPVLGYLDDLVLVPLGVYLALKMIPSEVLAEARKTAEAWVIEGRKPVSKLGSAIVIFLWLTIAVGVVWLILKGLGIAGLTDLIP
jgi:uncharacterized membrane protein YkvA (DUF1232 family)